MHAGLVRGLLQIVYFELTVDVGEAIFFDEWNEFDIGIMGCSMSSL